MARYLDLTAWLFLGWGMLQLTFAVALGGFYALFGVGAMVFGAAEGEPAAVVGGAVFIAFALMVAVFITLFAAPSFAATVGIRRRVPWGRVVGIVASALAMMNFPIGTALGVFALIVLLDQESGEEFADANRVEHAP